MKSPGIKYGVIAGVIGVVIELISYLLGYEYFFGFSKVFVGIGVTIWAMILAGKLFRENNGGFASWKEMLKTTFVVGIVATIIGVAFQFLLYNLIDPNLAEAQKDFSIELIESMGETFSLDEALIELQIDEAESKSFEFGFSQAFLGLLVSFIIMFILASIVSVFVKRNRGGEHIV